MKKLRMWLAIALCCLLTVTVSLNTAKALDFGDFSGDSDYGSSSSDWSSSDSDWGSSSWGSSSGGYYYSGSGGSSISLIPMIIIVIVIVIVIFANRKSSGSNSQPVAAGATRTDASKLKSVSEYLALDANFNETAFSEKLSNRYVQMQNAWQAKDLTAVRPFFTDAYYAQMERQVQNLKTNKQTNYVERVAVLGVNVRGFYQANGMDHMIAELSTRIVDYTLNDANGELVKGSKTVEKFMVYEWDLVRKSGVITGVSDGMTVNSCPNCGAPVSINATAKCPYCDSVIIVEANDWAISAIKGISQRSAS